MFQTDGQISTPPDTLLLFFPLSARGPTRRRNSTGLAELWGGWPIEQERGIVHTPPLPVLNLFLREESSWQ